MTHFFPIRGLSFLLLPAISFLSARCASRGQLEYKSKWYGRTLVKIDRFYPSSKTCSACQHVLDSLTLDIREWVCPECGTVHDRDTNAACNILAEGLSANVCGGSIRPVRANARRAAPNEAGSSHS